MAVANNITAVVNFIAFLCSIPIIAAGIWLASKPDNECIHLFRWPVVILGFLVLLVSLAGFVGAYWYKETLLAFYLCCMAILIGLLLILLVFAFVVTRRDGGYDVPGRGYKEYRLEGFSSWLRDHVVDSKNWRKISACLAESDVCAKVNQNFVTADQFFMGDLSPLQASSFLHFSSSLEVDKLSPHDSQSSRLDYPVHHHEHVKRFRQVIHADQHQCATIKNMAEPQSQPLHGQFIEKLRFFRIHSPSSYLVSRSFGLLTCISAMSYGKPKST